MFLDFSACAKKKNKKKKGKKVMCSACFGRFLKFPACHPRRGVQVWKDAAVIRRWGGSRGGRCLAPGKFLVMREGEKLKMWVGSERRTRLPPTPPSGWSLYVLLFCFLLLLSALIVALRQKSRPQEPAAQTFETEATLASKPALSFLFSVSSSPLFFVFNNEF